MSISPDKAAWLEQQFEQAMAHHRNGELDQAESLYRTVLKQSPGQPDCLHLLGVIAGQRGDHRQAAKLIRQAIRGAPDVGDYHANLGLSLHQQGRYDEAVSSLKRAVKLQPDHVPAWFSLGNSLLHAGKPERAAEAFEALLRLVPHHLPALNNLGNVQRELGQYDQALATLEQVVELQPDAAEAWYNIGVTHDQAENPERAVPAFEKAVELQPAYAQAWTHLGNALADLRRYDEAIAAYEQSMHHNPEHTDAWIGRALVHQVMGRFDASRADLEHVLVLEPHNAGALLQLSAIHRCSADNDPLLEQAETALHHQAQGERQKVQLAFALGKWHDDYDDTAHAFTYFKRGNRLMRKSFRYQPEDFTTFVDRVCATFTPEFLKRHAGQGNPDTRPVFIVGMPRSGTSLVEQILASHPQVHGAGELHYWYRTTAKPEHGLWQVGAFPEAVADLASAQLSALTDQYLQVLAREAGAAARISDKMPYNFMFLGLIAALLPNARVIHCRRDPLDTGWSIYSHYFVGEHPYAWDLAEIGRYHRDYQRLMAHWREVLPLPLLEVDYESLVQETEARSREMIEFLELPWDERCLAFHEQVRPVTTISQWQVRQPVYSRSVQRWRAYEEYLQPLKLSLGME